MSKPNDFQSVSPEMHWINLQSSDYLDPKMKESIIKRQAAARQRLWDKATLSGKTADMVLTEISRLPGLALESAVDWGYGKAQDKADEIAAKFGMLMDTPAHKAFRWNNFELGRDITAIRWAIDRFDRGEESRVYDAQPGLRAVEKIIDQSGLNDPLVRSVLTANLFSRLESAMGHPWINANEEEARGTSHTYMDPSWLATPFARWMGSAKSAANIAALEKEVPALLKAAEDGHGMFMAAARNLYGFPTDAAALHELVKSGAGAPVKAIAAALYNVGLRSAQVAAPFREVNFETFRAPLFKAPGMLMTSTGSKALDAAGETIIGMAQKAGRLLLNNETRYDTRFGSIAHEQMKSLQRVSDATRNAMNVLGHIPEAQAQSVHEILQKVGRVQPMVLEDGSLDISRTVSSFKANYVDAVKTGKIARNDKAFDIAERAVKLMSSGWDPQTTKWWGTLSVNPKFMETGELDFSKVFRPLQTPWHRPNIGYAEKVTGPALSKFVVQVATREQRVSAVNSLIQRSEDLTGKLSSMRTRMGKLYEFAAKDSARPGAATFEDIADYSKMRKMEDLLDMGVNTMGERIPSMTELMTERKALTDNINQMKGKLGKFSVANIEKLGEKGVGRELYGRYTEIVNAQKRVAEIDTLRKSAGQAETIVQSDFEQMFAAVTRGDATPEQLAQMRELVEATGMGQAIRTGRGKEYMDSLNEYVRTGIKTSRRVVRDMRAFREVEDPIEALGKLGMSKEQLAFGERNVFGKLLTAYNSYVLGPVRTAQIVNPATITTNFLDTAIGTPLMHSGTADLNNVFASIRQGKPAELYTWMGEKVGHYADNSVAQLARDIGGEGRWYSKALGMMSEGMTTGENIGRRGAWFAYYDEGMKDLTSKGFSVPAADKIMTEKATKFTDAILVNYNNMSGAERALRHAILYPVFNSRYALNYFGLGLTHGTETVQAARHLADYFAGSDDGRGYYDIGHGVMVNPVASLSSASNLLRGAEAVEAVMDPETRMGIAAMKVSNALFGNVSAPVAVGAAAAGAFPEQPAGAMSKWDNLIAPIAEMLTGRSVAPGDLATVVVGQDPAKVRERRTHAWEQRIAIANQRAGRTPIPPAELRKQALVAQAKSAATTLVVPGGAYKGELAAVLRDETEANRIINRMPEHLQDSARDALLAEPRFKDLAPVLRSPAIDTRAYSQQTGIGPIADEAARAVRPSIGDRIERMFSGGEPPNPGQGGPGDDGFAVQHSTQAPEALRQFIPEWPTVSGGTVGRNSEGTLTVSGVNYDQASRSGQLLNTALKSALRQRWTAEGIHQVVAAAPDSVKALIRGAAEIDPYYGRVWRQYMTVEGGQQNSTSESFIDAPEEVYRARVAFSRYFERELQRAGGDAEQLASQGVDFWRAKVLADSSKLPGWGLNSKEAVAGWLDWTSLDLARARLPDGFGERYAQMAERRLQDKYPSYSYWMEQLKSAAYYNPELTDSVVDTIQGEIAKGALPQQFWPILQKKQALFERVAATAYYPEVKASLERITRRDPNTGKPVALDIPALRYELVNGHVEGVSAIKAGWMGRDLQNQLENAIASEPLPDSTLGKNLPFNLNEIPFDPQALGQYFVAPFQARVGITRPEFYEAVTRQQQAIDNLTAPPVGGAPSPKFMAQLSQPEQPPIPFKAAPAPVLDARNMSGMIDINKISSALPVRTTPHQGIAGFWKSSVNEHAMRMQAWTSGGQVGPKPSLMASFASNLTYTPIRTTPTGDAALTPAGKLQFDQPRLAISPTQMAGAIQGAGQIAQAFGAFEQDDPAGRAFGGLGMGLAAYSTGSMAVTAIMGQAAAAGAMAGPVGIGIGVAAVGLGVAFGLMGGKGGGEARAMNEEANRINRERLELERERFAEQQRQQTVRDLESRERALTEAVRNGARTGPATRAAMLSYQRRGTFASKVGLVDAIERELASSLKPRW